MTLAARSVLFALLALLLAGCVYTKAVPIGGNVWRMQTDGYGAVGSAIARDRMLQEAAYLALNQGFTHFLLSDSPEGPEDIAARAFIYGDTRVVAFGSPLGGQRTNTPDVRTSVTVIMLRKGDPRIPKAYDALEVAGAAL